MNRSTISSDISSNSHKQQPRKISQFSSSAKHPFRLRKNCVLEDGKFVMCAKRREGGKRKQWTVKKKKQFCDESTTRFFHFACNELSNFPSSIIVKEKYEKYDKQIGIFYVVLLLCCLIKTRHEFLLVSFLYNKKISQRL
jgi:hypothetical protein